MRWIKLIMTGLVLAMVFAFIWQNLLTFSTSVPFTLNLLIRETLNWSHSLYTLLILAVLLGLVIGITLMMRPYLHIRRLLAQERQNRLQVRTVPEPTATETTGGETIRTPPSDLQA